MYQIQSKCADCKHRVVCKYAPMLSRNKCLSVFLYDNPYKERVMLQPDGSSNGGLMLQPDVFNVEISCKMFEEQPNEIMA